MLVLLRGACAALLTLALAGCGPDGPPAGPPARFEPPSVGGLYIGQEIWLRYQVVDPSGTSPPLQRSESQARAQIEEFHARAVAGADIGPLAREFSSAPGAVADGFVLLPVRPDAPDARDRALMMIREDETTPILPWREGFWFARRVSARRGASLKQVFEEALSSEARGQAILFHHKGAYPWLHDQKRTPEQAREQALAIHRRAMGGEDFAQLARMFSSDLASGEEGGHLVSRDPATGAKSPWIRLGNPDFGTAVVNFLLRSEVGAVVPQVLDTSRGYVVLKVVERRRFTR